MSRQILLGLPLISALAGAVSAESTTVVDLILPMVDQQTILASVVTADATATSYVLNCPPDADANDCGIGTGFTVFEGPSTLGWKLSMSEHSADVSCTITNEAAVCTDFATSESGKPYSDTITDYTDYSVPVTVTAGAELLNGGGSGGSSGSGTAAKTTKLTGTVQPTGTDTTISPSSTTGGLPRITQNAVLAGVAAVIGGAAML